MIAIMKIILVRHGAYNPSSIDPDNGLSDEGIEEVENLLEDLKKHKIHYTKVYTSPKTRALQTASLLADGQPVQITSLLDGTKDPMLIYHELQAQSEDVLCVTHNPFIAELASLFNQQTHFRTAGCLAIKEKELLWKNT